jgi:hypothetical protein
MSHRSKFLLVPNSLPLPLRLEHPITFTLTFASTRFSLQPLPPPRLPERSTWWLGTWDNLLSRGYRSRGSAIDSRCHRATVVRSMSLSVLLIIASPFIFAVLCIVKCVTHKTTLEWFCTSCLISYVLWSSNSLCTWRVSCHRYLLDSLNHTSNNRVDA